MTESSEKKGKPFLITWTGQTLIHTYLQLYYFHCTQSVLQCRTQWKREREKSSLSFGNFGLFDLLSESYAKFSSGLLVDFANDMSQFLHPTAIMRQIVWIVCGNLFIYIYIYTAYVLIVSIRCFARTTVRPSVRPFVRSLEPLRLLHSLHWYIHNGHL